LKPVNDKREIILAGYGGQGIITAGVILGTAASYDGYQVVQTQSYGAEARGTACKSELIISRNQIDYIKVTECNMLVALSSESLRYKYLLEPEALLIVDDSLVEDVGKIGCKNSYAIQADYLAENRLGSRIFANIIALGALSKLTNIVRESTLKKVIKETVPPKTVERNLEAFDLGVKEVKKTRI